MENPNEDENIKADVETTEEYIDGCTQPNKHFSEG